MLKFQRNRAKPAPIGQHLRAAENFEYYTTQRFGQQNQEVWPKSWWLNGNIFFELFLSNLDQKIISAGNERHKDENLISR